MAHVDVGGLEVRHIACNICGGIKAAHVAVNCGLHVTRCVECGLIFVNPQPTTEAILAYHSAHDLMMRNGWSSYFEHTQDQLEALWDERLTDMERWVGGREIRLLDVGCGPGDFLHFAHQRGWTATGFDFAPSVAQLAHDKYGLVVNVGDLASLEYPAGSFTILSMWHVLEHLRDPGAILMRAHELLAPDGLLVLEVPNVNCFWRRSYRYPFSAILHLFHFSPSTLALLVQKAGFELISCRHGNTGLLCSGNVKMIAKRILCGTSMWMDRHFRMNLGDSIRVYAKRAGTSDTPVRVG